LAIIKKPRRVIQRHALEDLIPPNIDPKIIDEATGMPAVLLRKNWVSAKGEADVRIED